MSAPWRLAGCAALAVLTGSGTGRAELSDDAAQLARAWQAAGQRVIRVAPMFLERGHVRPIVLPDAAWSDDGSCTTVALLAARSTDFLVRREPAVNPKLRVSVAPAERSAAGTALLAQCGSTREQLARLTVELRGARAALETIVAVGDAAAPAIGELLPERASGPVAGLLDTGARTPIAPLAVRAHQATLRAKAEPSAEVRFQTFTAERDGTGHQAVQLEEGCHRIDLLADLVARRALDLDADLRDAESDRILARDRSDSPDVRLDFCAGSAGAADLLFAGAPGPVALLLIDRRTPLPPGVPTSWGPRARAGLARAIARRTMPTVQHPPLAEWLGVAGVTAWRPTVEPGFCYVAAVATTRGEPRSVTLSANVDGTAVYDANTGRDDSAAVAFCAASEAEPRVEVEVRGNAVAWVASLWQLGARPLEEAR